MNNTQRTRKNERNILTATVVNQTTQPGMYPDGGGLYLRIHKTGDKYWVHRIVINKKRRDISLGAVQDVKLAQARAKARETRTAVLEGRDPLAEKKAAQSVMTFRDAAKRVYKNVCKEIKAEKEQKRWWKSLEDYVFPSIGDTPVNQVTTADIVTIIEDVEHRIPKSTTKLVQRIIKTFNYAIGILDLDMANPAQKARTIRPKIKTVTEHRPALHHSEAAAAIAKIQGTNATELTKLGIEMLIHTGARSRMIRMAKWDSINWREKTWTVPGCDMKNGEPWTSPLSDHVIKILEQARLVSEGHYLIFHGVNKDTLMSDSRFSILFRENNIGCVPHGFRSTLRDWMTEQNKWDFVIGEIQLAHKVEGEVAQAYARSTVMDLRRDIVNQWSDYLVGGSTG